MDLFPFKNNLNDYSSNIIQDKETGYLKTDDIIGLSEYKQVLNDWYYSPGHDVLLVIGPTGCGKTTLAELFCKESGILLYTALPKKDLLKDILLFLDNSSIFCKSSKNKLILIDEYTTSNTNLLSIPEILNLSMKAKVLVISASARGSNLGDLKKNTTVYCIPDINLKEIEIWIKEINGNNIPEQDLIKLVHKCKSDKRLLLNTVSFLKKSTSGIFINSFYKNSDINVNDFIKKLFGPKNKLTLNEIYKIYETDGYLISNLIHENYLDYSDDIDNIARSAEYISYGETIFSDTFESNKTFIPQSHCTNSIFLPSYYSRGITPKECVRSSIINNRFNILLNNQKIIDKINFGSERILSITDILYIKKFLTQQLIKNKSTSQSELDYLKNILGTFQDLKIEKMELIYKHFSTFKENIKEPKTKNFTLKFKEKLIKLIN